VTWNSPTALPSLSFQIPITTGVGSSTISHAFRVKKSAASGESRTLPYCPAPTIRRSAPAARP
jgi:hypothetical protein